ncbi:DUF4433 domain-containing protein [Streptomyces sp. NPDC004134]|uniref:type II toxin-antitoxin system toxin DNA ADP-ribosyl transferase DarT n=1 Tax=Streptomyces sp. NPDC004134 TaxID=3364691 RepID=UPI003674643B
MRRGGRSDGGWAHSSERCRHARERARPSGPRSDANARPAGAGPYGGCRTRSELWYALPVTQVGERQLFHFTHIRNLQGIFADKCLVSDTTMQLRGGVPVECGDRDIKAARRTRRVLVHPYGVPSDYVPFYFAPRSPMLYKINKGSVPTYQEGQTPLVYFVTTVDAAVATGQCCVFSDGNCAAEITRHFDQLDLLAEVVDWKVISARIWANTADDGDRMRRRMAEFLVHERLPLSAVCEVAAYDHAHAEQVSSVLRSASVDLPVSVRRTWYY